MLTDGVPQSFNATAAVPGHFVFDHVDQSANMTFEVFGRCALYSATFPDPSPDKKDKQGVPTSGGQIIRYATMEATKGMFYISAYPDGVPSAECSIVAFTAVAVIRLLDGIPIYLNDVCKWCYRYYVYDVVDPNLDVTVTLLPLDEGDPDVYGAFGYKPSTTNYTWASMRVDSDSFTALHTDPRFRSPAALQIAVYGWSASLFAIVAQTSECKLKTRDLDFPACAVFSLKPLVNVLAEVELVSGTTLAGVVALNQYRYYKVMTQSTAELIISVTPQIGDVDLYVGFGET